MAGNVIFTFLFLIVLAIWLLLIVRVILSWVVPRGGGGFTATIYQLTEPIVAPIRSVVPPAGGIDWSTMIAVLVFGFLMRLLS